MLVPSQASTRASGPDTHTFRYSDGPHSCPPSEEHPGGESVQQMQDRVDGLISKIRALHAEVSAQCP